MASGGPWWNVPYPRNSNFTGRESILARLEAALGSGTSAALTQAIAGLGGVGKTQTAVEYAYRHRDQYRAVLWVRADTKTNLASGYRALAEVLDLPEKDARDSNEVVAAVLCWLGREPGYLLILDNADDPDLVKPYLPLDPRGHVLLTSRASNFDVLGIKRPIVLPVLTPDEALAFLRKRTGRDGSLDPAEQDAAQTLAGELGYLPLALEQAAAYMVKHDETFAIYLDAYRTLRLKLLDKKIPLAGEYPETVKTVCTTWKRSFDAVAATSPASIALLRLSAFFAPNAIPYELILEGVPRFHGEPLDSALIRELDPAPVLVRFLRPLILRRFRNRNVNLINDHLTFNEQILTPLTDHSLVRRDREARTYSVHRLVQAVLRDELTAATRKDLAEQAVKALNQTFPDRRYANWPRCERLVPHAQAARDWIESVDLHIPEAARLLDQAGYYLWLRARYAEAEPLLRRALMIREALDPDHPDTATSLKNLAVLLRAQGRPEMAEPLLRRALKIFETRLGKEHPDAVSCRAKLDPVSVPADPSSGLPREFGGFTLLEELGRGGMGVVYRAWEKIPPREVALKMILGGEHASAEDLRRFENEAKILAKFSDLHIVKIYHVGRDGDQPFFTMPLIEGGSLGKYVPGDAASRGDIELMTPREAVETMIPVARAIHHAHQLLILHRDVTPSNILIDTNHNIPILTDVGLAKEIGSDGDTDSDQAQPRYTAGSLPYMAPEQASGKGEISTAADVYSLGATLYALLTGRPPFTGSKPEIKQKVIKEPPIAPREHNRRIDRDLEAIVRKCLEKDPRRRYESAADLAVDLERWTQHEPVRARRSSIIWWTRLLCRRHPVEATLSAVAAGLLIAATMMAVWVARGREARLVSEVGQSNLFEAKHVASRILWELKNLSDPVEREANNPRLRALLESADSKGLQQYTANTFDRYKWCDLQLMSSVNDVSGIPTGGKSLIIVAVVDHVLHFRIFDDDGRMIVDTDEKRLTEQAQQKQIEDLRKQLEGLWPPHELTESEKAQVIAAITSIVGHIRYKKEGYRLQAWYVLDSEGKLLAASPMRRPIIGKYYDWRDYFHGAVHHAEPAAKSRVHISQVFVADSDGLPKFAFSAPVFADPDHGRGLLGVVVATITTAADLGLLRLEDGGRTVALVGRREPNIHRDKDSPHGTLPAGQFPSPSTAQLPEFPILFHPGYSYGRKPMGMAGERIRAVLRPRPRDECRRSEEFRLPELSTGVVADDYRDPLEKRNPKYGGRWLAAFAPVGGTELVVVVQQRYDTAIAPDLTLALDSFLGGGVSLTLIAIVVGFVGYTSRRVAGWRASRGGKKLILTDGLTPPLPS